MYAQRAVLRLGAAGGLFRDARHGCAAGINEKSESPVSSETGDFLRCRERPPCRSPDAKGIGKTKRRTSQKLPRHCEARSDVAIP